MTDTIKVIHAPTWRSDCGTVSLYLGDCLELMPKIPRGIVGAVVMSPPYAEQREYGGGGFSWKNGDGKRLMEALPAGDDTQIFINCGIVYENGKPIEYWRDLFQSGPPFFGWYVWDQGFGLPGNWSGRLAPSFEFIFHFCYRPRQPNKIEPCVSLGRIISKTALTGRNGKSTLASGAGDPVNETKIPDSVFRITREMKRDIQHPARFPVALPCKIIDAYCRQGEIVLDPFMGSGTTGVACVRLGRSFIGCEIEPKYFDIAVRRIKAELAQPRLFAEPPRKPEQLTIGGGA